MPPILVRLRLPCMETMISSQERVDSIYTPRR